MVAQGSGDADLDGLPGWCRMGYALRPYSAAVRKKSCLDLACIVFHNDERGYVQAFHGLTSDLADEIEVVIEVQHRQSSQFSSRSDDQIRY
jgi:hypothetical protein